MRFRNRFGECKVICHLKDVAIVELENKILSSPVCEFF